MEELGLVECIDVKVSIGTEGDPVETDTFGWRIEQRVAEPDFELLGCGIEFKDLRLPGVRHVNRAVVANGDIVAEIFLAGEAGADFPRTCLEIEALKPCAGHLAGSGNAKRRNIV